MADSVQKAELFYEQFEPMEDLTYGVILSIVRDREAALDILQDTILLGIRHYDQLQNKEMLKPWILRIAKNESISYWRKQKNRRESPEQPEYLAALPLEDEQSVEGIVLAGNRREILSCAIHKLCETDRLMLHLRYQEDMKLTEIAELTGYSLSKVKSRLSRACVKLRKILESQHDY